MRSIVVKLDKAIRERFDAVRARIGQSAHDAGFASARDPGPEEVPAVASQALPITAGSPATSGHAVVDLKRRRDQLNARVAELQFDLGGLVYEMAIRDRIRVDVLVRRAAALQNADAELGEVERILRLEETSTAGACASCEAPHSSGAAYCWQCGQPLLQQVPHDAIAGP